MGDAPNHRPLVAVIAAGFLMLAFGAAHRALASRFAAPVVATPIAPDALERFPMQIGDWTGEDVPLDETVGRRTGTDAHINRRYSHSNGSGFVVSYIACGVRVDDVMRHLPEGCYPAAGWTLVDRCSTELPLNTGRKLPCTILQFRRGTLDTEKVTVLHYFIVDGQPCSNVSLLRSRIWRLFAMVNYVAQVQIVASMETPTTGSPTSQVCAFAVDSASPVARLGENLRKGENSGEFHKRLEGK